MSKSVPKVTRAHLKRAPVSLPRCRVLPCPGSKGWLLLRAICVWGGRFTIAEVARFFQYPYATAYGHIRGFKLSDYVRADDKGKLYPVNSEIGDELIRMINTSGQ